MITLLPKPKATLEVVATDCLRVDSYLDKSRIPALLKNKFGEFWGKDFEVGQDYIKLRTSRDGDKKRNYFVEDEVLLKCAFAVKIYDLYQIYMKYVSKLRENILSDSDSWKKCGEDKPLPDELKLKIKQAIANLPDLDGPSKANLERFLTDDKDARKEDFGSFKGLSRGDPFQPVAAGALGLRVDHYGIINDIILKLQENRGLLSEFIDLLDGVKQGSSGMEKTQIRLIQDFTNSLREIGFGGVQTGAKFVTSLLSKNLVILTGNSGSGKTRISSLFTQWLFQSKATDELPQIALIPVGADWTDNRHVLGFVNHLRPSSTSQPIYESTPILELIIRAKNDRTRPYFLILDEMNLSHVERYFADFLSAMESGRAIPLHTSATDLLSPQGTQVPASLNLPDNLFITGTVNVDETTYMFSPKVLDRANVIEFRVSPGDARAFLTAGAGGIKEINPAPAGAAEAFLALARKARQKPTPDLVFFTDAQLKTKRETLAQSLVGLFGLMHTHKLEFGYRTMNEVLRYAGVDYELAADRAQWSWETCLDVQILQKVLPKLHGSKKRIEPLLVDLAAFCETGAVPAQGKAVFTTRATGKFTFPDSYQKLAGMIEIVRRDQFVSFI